MTWMQHSTESMGVTATFARSLPSTTSAGEAGDDSRMGSVPRCTSSVSESAHSAPERTTGRKTRSGTRSE